LGSLPYLDHVIRSQKVKKFYEAYVEAALQTENLSLAKTTLECMIKGKKDCDALFSLGKIYLFENRFEEAEKCFEEVLRSHPEDRETLFLSGFSYLSLAQKASPNFDQGLVSKAKENLEKSFNLGFLPRHRISGETLAFLNDGRYKDALMKLKENLSYLLKVHKNDLFENLDDFEKLLLLFFLDETKIEKDSVEKTISEYENLAGRENTPTRIQRRLGIAYLLFLKVLFREGQRNLKVACELDPKFRKAKANLKILNEVEERLNLLYSNLELGL